MVGLKPRTLSLQVEYLELLTTPRSALFCAAMAWTGLLVVVAPMHPKGSAGVTMGVLDVLSGTIVAFFGFLAFGHWCLPEGIRLLETAVVLGPLGGVLAYRGRRRLLSLAAEPERFRRANDKLKLASWIAIPVSVALVFYTTLVR